MTISTHVLDTSIGRPAGAVVVRLQRHEGSTCAELFRAVTTADGRVSALGPSDASLAAGTYRLLFEVGAYFQRDGRDAFYGDIAIDFIVRDAAAHYHVPLLVSPFGYTTYRGS